MPNMQPQQLRLSKKKFINTATTPYVTAAGGESVTVGVFFDTHYAVCLPFWIALGSQNPLGLALDRLCRAANVPNTNNVAKNDNDKWFIFCLTSGRGVYMDSPVDAHATVGEVAVSGDVWFVTKGPILPEGLEEEAVVRLSKIGSRKIPHQGRRDEDNGDECAAREASPASSSVGPSPIVTITACFAELDDKKVAIQLPADVLVSDVLDALRLAEPEATKSGVRIMFFEKYVRREHDPIRAVPLGNGSTIDVCTGRYLSEHEMTLYLADRKLRETKEAITAHEGPIENNKRSYWNEQLMKSLMHLDSLQEVPDDIRARRKAGVKAVIAEQDRLLEMK